jgi:hypothetical protein
MPSSNSSPRMPSLLGSLTILLMACSNQGGDRPAAETASAPDTARSTSPAPSADTTTSQPDTPPSATAQQASAAKPAAPKTRVKPSIDPGRKQSASPTPAPSAAAGIKDTSAAAAPTASGSQDQYLKYDAASNTVTFELIGGPAGFQFNGYSSGGATLTLPPKANVVMNFINKDGTPHSAEVISGEGALPNASTDPAIPRAYTNQALQGLPQEATDVIKFTAPESGTFRIFCGVPGHGLSGMWIWMKIDPAAKKPSFGPTKG